MMRVEHAADAVLPQTAATISWSWRMVMFGKRVSTLERENASGSTRELALFHVFTESFL